MVPVPRSRTKTSTAPFVSPSARLVAADSKATRFPSREIRATPFRPLAFAPVVLTLTRLVVRPTRSRTRMSEDQRLGSLATRLWAAVLNATSVPSPETLGSTLYPSACWPAEPTLSRSAMPAASAGDAAASSNAATAETAILPICIPESSMARRADVLSRFSAYRWASLLW